MNSVPLIRVENLHHTYSADSPQLVRALRGVNLSIQPGEFLAIVGHNGSGKSTLARHLNGLLLPTLGDVWVKGWNTKDPSHRVDIRSTVGMVFQSPDNQIVATIVEEDVAFGPENLGLPRREIRARVEWALETVGMQEYRNRAPHKLSGGQKQRVALAGILALKPQVLVLDETTALLDPLGREQVMKVARRLNEQGVTIVAITHFMREAVYADRVIVMNEGQIALEGTPREVFKQVDRLRRLQLDAPEVTLLAQRLHSRIPTFREDVLTASEFVEATKAVVGPDPQPQVRVPVSAQSPNHPITQSPDHPFQLVDVRQLEYVYMRGTPLETPALHGVDLQVGRGQTIGVIGHTGSGKSTLIQHLNGLLRAQRGTVRVLDYDLSNPKTDLRRVRQRVGLAFQFPEVQLFERFVGDDVAFAPWQMGIRGEELKTRVTEAMEAVGLPFHAFKDRPLHTLSGGEKRRAALAGVLAAKPEILVLDEPTAGLDPRGHQDLLARLMALRASWGMTLILVSHNMDDILRLCDSVVVLAEGRTVTSGTPFEIFSRPERLATLGLGLPQLVEVLHALSQSGFHISEGALTLDQAEEEISKLWMRVPAGVDR